MNRNPNRKFHWAAGGFVLLASLLAYFRTVAPTTSFWDCGEFIACSLNLGVMHPPGAPLYLLIGRVLTLLPFVRDIGLRVNLFSGAVSAATVFLTYLIIVQLVERWRGKPATWEDRLIAYGSGILGSLALAFSDSMWFNAVEAEVYAFSLFFTALVVWLALHWGERSEKAGSLLLIFFIFYLFGLAAGVHLLNLLAFPFILFVAFFHDNRTVRRLLLLITVQAVVPIVLYILFYQFNPEKLGYAMLEHQNKAWTFLKWFGSLWAIGCLVYMYFKDQRVFKIWWIIPVFVIVGYSTYLAIYIRAGLGPPINMNDPSTLQGMSDYLGRRQYGQESLLLTFFHRKAAFWDYQMQMMFNRYFGWQFIGQGTTLDARDRIVEIITLRGLYGLPFLVGLWGAVHHFFRDWKRAASVFVLFFLTGYAIIIYTNQPDPQPRERDYVYVGAYFAFALWIGIGAAGILEWIAEALQKRVSIKRIALTAASVILLIAVPLNLFAFNFDSHDRAGNFVASDYSYNILQSCEPDAILFTGGDNDTYPLWYLQNVENIRTDVHVVCLALLNAHWYIKQIRDTEPRVPVRLSDNAVESLAPIAWEESQVGIPVPREVQERERASLLASGETRVPNIGDTIMFNLKPTFPEGNPQGLRMQDLMILRILQMNQWRRPVYFASTVGPADQLGLQPFLRMDGLAHRILPYRPTDIHEKILRTNLLEKFRYRNLGNTKVYLNVGASSLFLNPRQAYLQLVRYYLRKGDKQEARFILEQMEKNMPREHIPYSSPFYALTVAELYMRAGEEPDLDAMMAHVIQGRSMRKQEWMTMADYFYVRVFKEYDRAEAIYRRFIEENPRDVESYGKLIYLYRLAKQYAKGVMLLEDWVARHPNDEVAVQELEEMRELAVKDSSG